MWCMARLIMHGTCHWTACLTAETEECTERHAVEIEEISCRENDGCSALTEFGSSSNVPTAMADLVRQIRGCGNLFLHWSTL
jgi:hypothetical protein